MSALSSTWHETLTSSGLSLDPPLSAIKIAGNRGAERKVIFLIFERDGVVPACIVKTVRSGSGAERLHNEFERQEIIYNAAGDGVPQPIGLFVLHSKYVLIETAITGQSLQSLIKQGLHRHPSEVRQDLEIVLTWLQNFQKRTTTGDIPLHEAVYLPDDLPAPIQTQVDACLSAYGDVRLPLTAWHGDFWAGNILLDETSGDFTQLGVIDWEDFMTEQLPFMDAFFFLTTYSLTFPWSRWRKLSRREAFRRGFMAQNWLSALLAHRLAHYAGTLNIPVGVLPVLFLHFLHEMAYGRDHRQAQAGLQRQWQTYLQEYMASPEQHIWKSALKTESIP